MSVREKDDPSLGRIGAFSDGVFAFAITLMILAIRIPHPTDADSTQGLLALLTEQWRSYIAYSLSFMLIGINWTAHRTMFSNFDRVDHILVWLNLLYLMGVAFMPIPTAVLGAWLGDPQNQVVAAVFYGGGVTFLGLIFNLLWWYGAYAAKLTSRTLTESQRRAHTAAWAPAPVVCAGFALFSLVNPALAVVGYVLLVFAYVLPVPRLLALVRRPSARKGKV